MKKSIWFYFFILCLMLILHPASVSAADVVDSGNCGTGAVYDTVTWTLDSAGLLTVRGTGDMDDYTYKYPAPWHGHASEINRIRIEGNVTGIGELAFYNCYNLTGVNISGSVANIGAYAFHCCESLEKIMIPDSVTNIEEGAFLDCEKLSEVVIPNTVTHIGGFAFGGTEWMKNQLALNQLVVVNGILIEGKTVSGNIDIPDNVTKIGDSAFYNCESLTGVNIPDSVIIIEDSAFNGCEGLTDVKFPNSITSIESNGFLGCSKLIGLRLPDSVMHIGENAFGACKSLTDVKLPNDITSIESEVFWGCSSLTDISIPEKVNKIGFRAFRDCNSLISINIPDNVVQIEDEAFMYCNSLARIKLPDSVTVIGAGIFSGCTGLRNVKISSRAYAVSENMFSGCSSLTSVKIPDGIQEIYTEAFLDCMNLTEIDIPDSVNRISSRAFAGCVSLTEVCIPDRVWTIGTEAFRDCSSLTDVNIPRHVNRMEDRIFSGCNSLKNISISNSVTNIYPSAFSECSSLTDIYYSGSESEWASISIFSNNESLQNAEIHYNSKWNFSLFQTKSTKYNNALARIAADMSEKTEDGEDAIRELYHSCGLYACEYKNFSFADWKSAAYAIGQDTIAINGVDTTILVITARGTKNLAEGIGDLRKGGEIAFLGTQVWKNVYDFEEEIWNGLNDYIDKYPAIKSKQNLKILVNGHSLGGAAANLLGARFTHEVGGSDWWSDLVEKEDIYVYTFGAIKVLTEVHKNSNISEGYENIHNIYNYFDSYGPHGNQSWTNVSVPKAKFGHTEVYQSYRFKYDETPNIPWLTCNSHQMSNYKAALEEDLVSCSDGKRIRAKERLAKLKEHVSGIWQNVNKIISGISVLCPVDVEIYTSDGRLAGSITDNAAGETISDKVYICIEGDEKYIYLLDDGSYTLRLKGTAGGTMEYSVQNIDIDTGEAAEEQTFANVSLEADKQFAGSVKVEKNRITDIETEEVRLYVVDGNGKPQKEVLPDGSGTEVSVSQKTEDSGSGKENSAVKVSKIQISGISKKIAAGKKIVLKAEISPANATNKAVSWSVDNTKYAAVDNSGVVTIKKAGKGKTVTITAAAKDGSKARAVYQIKCMKGAVKEVTVSGKRTRSAKAGSSIKLKAKVKASRGANKALQWISSNFKYASVDKKGKVTLNKAGKGKTVKITAMATDGSGKKAVIKIKMK